MSPPAGIVAEPVLLRVRGRGVAAGTAPRAALASAMVGWPICSGGSPSAARKPGSDSRIRTCEPPAATCAAIRSVWLPQLPLGGPLAASTGAAQAPVHDWPAGAAAVPPPACGVAVVVFLTAIPNMCRAAGL